MKVILLIFPLLGIISAATHRQCQKFCAAVYSPVCGSNHVTYSNMCKLQIAECEAKYSHRHLSLAHTGRCSSVSPHTDHYDCKNPSICDDEDHNLVCGTDGVTYENPCLLQEAACGLAAAGKHMSQAHTGECTDLEARQDCPHFCDDTINPVCSKGNHTYKNPCVLKQSYCRFLKYNNPEYLERYEVAHNGTCDGSDPFTTVKVDCSKYMLQGAIAVEGSAGLISCPYTTSLNRHFICGADKHTYSSECSYCRSAEMHNKLAADKTVEVLMDGICPYYLTQHVIG